MTDKEQIIIDGVDVSGCSGFSNNPEDVKTGQTCWYYTEYVHDNEWGTRCPEHPNCEYKQLQRKTQECEELKAYAQRQENQREEYYKEYLKLSQECEKLKRKVELMMDCPDCKVDEFKKALDEIERICLEEVYIYLQMELY